VLPDNPAEDESFLQALHTVLMDTQVKEGKMICSNCQHCYPIKDGIANMLLREDEV
jgi:multifunctional methyltransferase subunit TRM112